MKAQKVGDTSILISVNATEADALRKARRAIKKASIAKDMGRRGKTHSEVIAVNDLIMLSGRILDAERGSAEETSRAT